MNKDPKDSQPFYILKIICQIRKVKWNLSRPNQWFLPNNSKKSKPGDSKFSTAFHHLMLLRLFSLILLMGSVFAAPLPSQDVYDECKDQIISLSKKYSKKPVKIVRKGIIRKKSLFMINANNLLDLLNDEVSDEVLVIIFFAYTGHKTLLVNDISSLLNLKASPRIDIPLKKIFQNYRRFLLRTFIKVKDECFCSNSPNRSTGFDLLRKFDSFWDNRLARLARQLLSKEEYVEELIQFKSRIRFLDTFLNNDFESLMIYEFKRLYKVFQNIGTKNPTAMENFIFLTKHLEFHLRNVDSPDFYKWLNLLASQIPEVILFFSYFFRETLVTHINRPGQNPSFASRDIQGMSGVTFTVFSWDKVTLRLSEKSSIFQPDIQIADLADIIKKKIETFNSWNLEF
jgi:hypothetical protein